MSKTSSSRPMALTVSSPFEVELNKQQMARLWASFLSGGTSHSARASTLPALIRRCEREGRGYVLHALPGMGYRLEPKEET